MKRWSPPEKRMSKYDHSKGTNQRWVSIEKIVVKSEREKRELLAAFEYIHDMLDIDTDYNAVNMIAHMYCHPDRIVVNPKHRAIKEPNIIT